VVPHGVDLASFGPRPTAAYRSRLQLEGRRVIGYAGRLERLKGVDLLLEAFAVLRATGRHDDAVVLVAGGDSHDGTSQSNHPGGEVGRLRALADHLGIAPAVRFLGPLPAAEVADLFSLADVVVVPSRTESFGRVALEALAAGTPVVTGTVGGLGEIVQDGVSGYLVAERTPTAFAAGIAAVLDDRSMAERMSVEGRHRAEHFTWGRAARRLAAIYDRLTSSAGDRESPCGEPVPCP
jgi:D-inositol-3-phosphate glycosyltransferase